MTIVKFYNPSFVPDINLTYPVVAARFKDKWLFVRQKDLTTWEIAGEHIEENESPFDVALQFCRQALSQDVYYYYMSSVSC